VVNPTNPCRTILEITGLCSVKPGQDQKIPQWSLTFGVNQTGGAWLVADDDGYELKMKSEGKALSTCWTIPLAKGQKFDLDVKLVYRFLTLCKKDRPDSLRLARVRTNDVWALLVTNNTGGNWKF
jgi:hypothetical protein